EARRAGAAPRCAAGSPVGRRGALPTRAPTPSAAAPPGARCRGHHRSRRRARRARFGATPAGSWVLLLVQREGDGEPRRAAPLVRRAADAVAETDVERQLAARRRPDAL